MTFRRIDQIDTETGEIIGNALTIIPVKHQNAFKRGWVAMSQPETEIIALSDLTGDDLRVFLMIVARLDFENFILINQSELARKMGMRQPHVSRSLKRLVDMEVLIEGPRAGASRTYHLNPTFGWKGSAKNHKNVIELDKKKAKKAPKK